MVNLKQYTGIEIYRSSGQTNTTSSTRLTPLLHILQATAATSHEGAWSVCKHKASLKHSNNQ